MAEEKKKNKSFVLRVGSATMEALEKWAADEFRSVNGQLQWIIAEALRRNSVCLPVARPFRRTVGMSRRRKKRGGRKIEKKLRDCV